VDRTARLELIDAVIYGDCFDCAVRLAEVHRGARVEVAESDLPEALETDRALAGMVTVRNGFVCLSGREHLIAQRPERIRRAERIRPQAERTARLLNRIPFVRGIALTGSLAADDAPVNSDADMLVICEGARMGTVFLIAATLGRLAGRRLCPNFYLASDRLDIQPSNVYEERELLQTKPLSGIAPDLHSANPWLWERFPNARAAPPVTPGFRAEGSRIGAWLERRLKGVLGDRLERWGRRVAVRRLAAHHAKFDEPVPPQALDEFRSQHALRFHGGQWAERIVAEYERRREHCARTV